MKIKKAAKLTSLLIAAGVLYQAFNRNLKVRSYELKSGKIQNDLRIVFLSDLHNNLYGDNQSDLIAMVADQKPDLVLLGGDFFDQRGPSEASISLLDWLSKNVRTYFVQGNHDHTAQDISSVKKVLKEFKIPNIEGKTVRIPFGQTTYTISGVCEGKGRKFKKQLSEVGGDLNPANYNILLTHRPDRAREMENYPFDLVLTGHTHGGQVRIPGLLNGLYAPGQGFFPEYAGGFYELNNGSTLIVNRGLMTQYQPVPKIFNRPEVVVIDLLKAD